MKKRLVALLMCATLLCSSSVYAAEVDAVDTDFTSDETSGTTLIPSTESTEEPVEPATEMPSAFPELDDSILEQPTEPVEEPTEQPVEEPTEQPVEVTTTEVNAIIERNPSITVEELPDYATQSLCAEFAVGDKPWLQGGYRVIWVDGLPFYVAVSESFDSMLDRIMTAVRENPDSTWAILKCDSNLDIESISKASEIYEVDDVFILRYDSEKTAEKDTKKLDRRIDVDFAELDAEMQTETIAEATTEIDTQTEHPIVTTVSGNTKTVAVLDTGVNLENDSTANWLLDGINLTEENSIADGNGHGTLMSKIIREYSTGSAKILPVKIANANGEATLLSAFLGIKYAVKHGADIINLSMITKDSVEAKCLEYAIDEVKIAQVVVSAGNQGSDVKYASPANIDGAIVVSAVEDDGSFAEYSNSGRTVDLSAPGSYEGQSGTSCAAAVVSGLLCNNTYDELVVSGQDLGDEGWDELYGEATVRLDSVSSGGTSASSHSKNDFVFSSSSLLVQGNQTGYSGGNYGYFWAGVQYEDGTQISSYKVNATIYGDVTEIGQSFSDVYTFGYPVVGRDGMSWLSESCDKQWGADTLVSSGWGWTYTDGAEVSIGPPWTFETRQYVWYFPLRCTKTGYHVSNVTAGGVQTAFWAAGDTVCSIQDTNGLGVTNNLGDWYHNTLMFTLSPNSYTMTIRDHVYNPQTGQWDDYATRTETATYGSTYVPSYSTPGGYYNHSRSWNDGWTVSGDGIFDVFYYPNTYTMTMYHKYYDPESASWVDFATTTASALYNSVYTPAYSDTPSGYHNHYRDWDGGWTVSGDGGFNVYYCPNTYKCYFNANGGTVGNSDPLTFTFNSRSFCLGCAPSATRKGFTFLGWYTATSGGQQVFDTSSHWSGQNTGVANWGGWLPDGGWCSGLRTARWVYAADATVYAQWSRNKYTVTYDCKTNGGDSDFTASVYYDYDIDFTKTGKKTGDTGVYSDTNKDGWQFVGWNTNKNAKTGLTSMKMPANNVTLYAIFKKTITASFKQYEYTGTSTTADVSTVYDTSHSATVYNNTTTAELAETTYKSITGWTRDGWTTGTDEKSAITTNFTINQDTQYYMRYSRYVQADFISESTRMQLGGTRYRNSASINTSAPIAITTPVMKAKTDWTQVGWSTSKTANAAITVKQKTAYDIYDNISVYGRYNKSVTLSYDANGGETTPAKATKTAYYNTAGNVSYPAFKVASAIHQNALAFSNWNTRENGKGTTYQADKNVTFKDSTLLYASFSNIDVTAVTLNMDSASLLVGDTTSITATVTPASATHENIIYKSKDDKVATVDGEGTVTAVSAGTTTITATSVDNPKASATCKITVSSGSVSVPEKLVLGTQGKITLKNSSEDGAKSSLYLSGLSNLVGVESGKQYALVFDVLNGEEATTKDVNDVILSTTSEDSIVFTVHPNVSLNTLVPDKYNATVHYKYEIER